MNIVITGGGKGIGLALVKGFLKEGGHQVWTCSRDVSELQTIQQEGLFFESLDLTQTAGPDLQRLVSTHFDVVDILIHNAGVLVNEPFVSTSIDTWRLVFELNVFAAVNVTQALLPLLRKSNAAHIVHIGSMGGVQGTSKFPGLSAYSASKAALANLTECLAEELKPDGIHVNCLALGAVDTAMLRAAFPGYQAPATAEEMAAFIQHFSVAGRNLFNGKILPVASSTP